MGVSVEVMGEQKQPVRVGVVFQPFHGASGGLVARAAARVVGGVGEIIVVGVESLIHREAGIEDEGTGEGPGRESLRFERFGQGVGGRWQEDSLAEDAVDRRDLPGHHGTVRRQRGGNGGVGVGEQHAMGGQAINVGGGLLGVAVAAEPVGPAGVEADQHHVADRIVRTLAQKPQARQGRQRSGDQAQRHKPIPDLPSGHADVLSDRALPGGGEGLSLPDRSARQGEDYMRTGPAKQGPG